MYFSIAIKCIASSSWLRLTSIKSTIKKHTRTHRHTTSNIRYIFNVIRPTEINTSNSFSAQRLCCSFFTILFAILCNNSNVNPVQIRFHSSNSKGSTHKYIDSTITVLNDVDYIIMSPNSWNTSNICTANWNWSERQTETHVPKKNVKITLTTEKNTFFI